MVVKNYKKTEYNIYIYMMMMTMKHHLMLVIRCGHNFGDAKIHTVVPPIRCQNLRPSHAG